MGDRKPLIIRGARQVGKTFSIRELGKSFESFVEVKSGATGSLRSLHLFLKEHVHTPFGIRFSSDNYSVYEKIRSYPLYAAALGIAADRPALDNLFQ